MSLLDRRCTLARSVVGLLTAAVTAGGFAPSTARAHTDLEFTVPADGAAVDAPVAEVIVGFTQPVTLIGSGFEVLDPQGNVVTPVVDSDDDREFRLHLDPPLAGGEAAVRWEVRAADGHTITGGVSFTVSLGAARDTTVPVVPGSIAPSTSHTSQPNASQPDASSTLPPRSTSATSAPSTTDQAVHGGAGTSAPTEAPNEQRSNGATGVALALGSAAVVGAAAFVAIRSRASTRP